MKKHIIISVASFSLFIVPCFASGSGGGGSFGGGGGGARFSGGGGSYKKKPKEKKQIDQELYKLGQAVVTGNAEISEDVISLSTLRHQERKFASNLAKMIKISENNAGKLDVEKLSGRLTPEQYKAVNYYIDVRYIDPSDYAQKGSSAKGKGKRGKKK